MFTAEMIAPCGLDCSLCTRAQQPKDPCPGCMGPDENKPEFCAARCDIIRCRKRSGRTYRFCDECPDFPCEYCLEREDRYMSQYALKESPLTNLRVIREEGMEVFLRREREAWTCKECGGPICVHDGTCSGCGRSYPGEGEKEKV